MFADHEAGVREGSLDDLVDADVEKAAAIVIQLVKERGSLTFEVVAALQMEQFMLREPNINDLLVRLAHEGILENTLGSGTREPKEKDAIKFAANNA